MTWALDIILLLLVLVCTWYCWTLNRRIKGLQDSKEEFAKMLTELDSAVNNASKSVGDLQELSNSTSSELVALIAKADELKSELLMLNKVGNNLADRLEDGVKIARDIPEHTEKSASNSKKSKAKKPSKAKSAKVEKASIEHKNDYDPKILEITTESGDKASMDQNSYFESLKKISVKK